MTNAVVDLWLEIRSVGVESRAGQALVVRVFSHLECSIAGGLGDAAVRRDLEVGGVVGPATYALITTVEHFELCMALSESHACVAGYLKCTRST